MRVTGQKWGMGVGMEQKDSVGWAMGTCGVKDGAVWGLPISLPLRKEKGR